MKVLEIISVGYVAGGAENTIVKIGPYLAEKGYQIKTLASDLGPEKKHFNEYTFKNVSFSGPFKLLFFLFNPSSFFALRRVLKEYGPDIVHIHVLHEITPSVLFLLKKYPTVITLHGPETFLRGLLIWCLKPSNFKGNVFSKQELSMSGKFAYFYFNSIQKIFYRLGFKNVDLFIAPSKYIRNVSKVDVLPIVHLPNFVELGKFHELKNNYNLLFVGRLQKMKGVEYLIKALPLIVEVFPQTTLTIIGDGPDKGNLLDQAKALQIEKHVQFVGWVENKDLITYYEKASIVVVPSAWAEAFGLVTLEAMSAGRPVIGTRVGGIPEVIDDGVNGYLVEPKNPEQIAEKALKLLSEEELLKELGRNARKKAETFSIEKYVENLIKLYEQVIIKYKREKQGKWAVVAARTIDSNK